VGTAACATNYIGAAPADKHDRACAPAEHDRAAPKPGPSEHGRAAASTADYDCASAAADYHGAAPAPTEHDGAPTTIRFAVSRSSTAVPPGRG
jgi:hypothetical protein